MDCIIRNGRIIDGSGQPAPMAEQIADIGIADGKIVKIEADIKAHAENNIDAQGLVVSPGFIDIHSHSDATLAQFPDAHSRLLQGVTTEVVGNCGISMGPVSSQFLKEALMVLGTAGSMPKIPQGTSEWSWQSMMDYLKSALSDGISVNIAPLVGHGTLRCAVMGFEEQPADAEQMAGMKRLLQRELDQGAFGMSGGLIYHPGAFAGMDELAEINTVVAEAGGIFSLHMRSEGNEMLEAVKEALEISARSGVSLEISHLKCDLPANWGKSVLVMEMLDHARSKGIPVDFDEYPYPAWSTGLLELFPTWAKNKGPEHLIDLLSMADTRGEIIRDMAQPPYNWEYFMDGMTWDKALLTGFTTRSNLELEGKNIEEIAQTRHTTPLEVVCDLFIQEQGRLSLIGFTMSNQDLERFLVHPATMIGSDGMSMSPTPEALTRSIHPRSYGTFARVLAQYVREKNLLTLETAVAKMTGMPARKLGFRDRGLIREEYMADITIFDPDTIQDQATFTAPHQTASGVHYVLVNGEITVREGRHTGCRSGRILSRT